MRQNNSTQILLAGNLAPPSMAPFLRCPGLFSHAKTDFSLRCDLFHLSVFLDDILQFLKNCPIQSLELSCYDDERTILESHGFSNMIHAVLASLSPPCERVSFTSPVGQVTRAIPLFFGEDSTPSCAAPRSTISEIQSITEFRLSSVFSRPFLLRHTLAVFLQHSAITSLHLDCAIGQQNHETLSAIILPNLEKFSLTARGYTPTLPTSFCRRHQKLAFVSMLSFCSWDDPDGLRPSSSSLLLPPASHITISSNYPIIKPQKISRLDRLDIVSCITLPVPDNRGYCDAVASLTTALRAMSPSFLPSSFTASFTFPRLLRHHIQFCNENIYRCSCDSFTLNDPMVKNVQYVEVVVDVISSFCMVN